jgi:hypothetical protein
MPKALNINDILSSVKNLDKQQRLTLLERLIALIRKEETQNKPAKLSKISGIGSKVWKSTNIDEYIEQERKW